MTTCEPLSNGGSQNHDPESTLFAVDFPASHSPVPALVEESPMRTGCGQKWRPSFAWFDRDTSSWKTSQLSLPTMTPGESCSPTWPRSGSMRNGQCYQRALWVLHTHETECFFWPTPRAMMSRVKVHFVARREGGYGLNLEEVVAQRESGPVDGYLNPRWIEWLMGFPQRWCEVLFTPLETPSSPKSPNTLAG